MRTTPRLADSVQRDTGIPYLLLDGGLRQTPGLLRIVGDLLGVPERGVALAAWAERALAETGGRTANLDADQRRRAYFGRGADGLDTGGANFINVESLEVAGLVERRRGAGARLAPGDAGAGGQVAARPDRDRAAGPAGQARCRSGLEHGDRGRGRRRSRGTRRPVRLDRRPPGPNRLLGLYWLDAIAYPGASGVDLGERAREFYRLFYDVDLTPDGLGILLGTGQP